MGAIPLGQRARGASEARFVPQHGNRETEPTGSPSSGLPVGPARRRPWPRASSGFRVVKETDVLCAFPIHLLLRHGASSARPGLRVVSRVSREGGNLGHLAGASDWRPGGPSM